MKVSYPLPILNILMLTTRSLFDVGYLERTDLLTRSDGFSCPIEKFNNENIANNNTNDTLKNIV